MPGFFRVTTYRWMIALALAGLYFGIALTPLAPLAMKSSHIVHVVTGECSGDCDIDGCSPASRAAGTCCCRQKQLLVLPATNGSHTCCPNVAVKAKPAASDCCDAARQAPAPPQFSCCAAGGDSAGNPPGEEAELTDKKRQTVYKCGSPCGRDRLITFAGNDKLDLIPFTFSGLPVSPHEELPATPPSSRFNSRDVEPPEPPPKVVMPV
ncbi:hypothetical protein KI809_13890 [Geobacter pelophilus]|uniref:Uncharacterized protein n=1 Tax=Geoanaerobacter pelophilus TaxID=60036 RepID=A0AAW4LBI6_9BACT|nr:hypothetical protein [Geoanaerobacter pelophilus]MBT0665394.1 hypothetical protein [Geoanaerobacter pelophilus]